MSAPTKPPENEWGYDQYYDAPDGKRYQWDPDYKCWYATMTREEWEAQSHWQKFDWIYWIIGLSVLCFIVEAYA